jgi:hypothetical protein
LKLFDDLIDFFPLFDKNRQVRTNETKGTKQKPTGASALDGVSAIEVECREDLVGDLVVLGLLCLFFSFSRARGLAFEPSQ